MTRKLSIVPLLVLLLFGLACLRGAPAPGRTEREVTRVIWMAGSVALEAKAAYQDGTIAPRMEYRQAINALGLAYEEAKRVDLAYLDAKSEYQFALLMASGCPEGDQACLDAALTDAARKEAAMNAAFTVLQRAVVELPAHIEAVKKIIGKG